MTSFDREDIALAMNRFPDCHKGGFYESIFSLVLDDMQKEGVIDSFTHYKQYSQQDLDGVDFRLYLNGDSVPISVTSSPLGANERRNKHPDIPVIAILHTGKFFIGVKETSPFEHLREQTIKAIEAYLSQHNTNGKGK